MMNMINNKSSVRVSDWNKRIVIITCLIMFLSLYAPYIRVVTYLYQIMVLFFVLLVARRKIASAIVPLVVLTTTRDYIAASVSESFSAYYGINGLILVAIMLIIAFIFLYKKHFVLQSTRTSIMLVLFGLQMLLSRFFAVSLDEYGQFFIGICIMYMIFPYVIECNEDIIMSRIAFSLSGAFMAIGILPYILTYSEISAYTAFINGNSLLVDRNYQSLFVMMCVLETIVLLIENGKKWHWLIKSGLILTIIADLVIVISGGSRSAILTMIAAAIVYLYVNRKNARKILPFLVIVGFSVIVAFQKGLFDVVLGRFHAADVASGNGRVALWKSYIDCYCDGNIVSWLFGRGLVGKLYVHNVAHNVFVSILFCFGVIGIVLYVGNIVVTIANCMKTKHTMELIVLIPLLIMCCTLEPYYRIECAIYIPVVSSTAIYYKRRR